MTLLEITFVMAIMGTMATIALPMTKGLLNSYHLQAASTSLIGTIQTTRYEALMKGYSYTLSFNPANEAYQVATEIPPATTFTNSGGPGIWCTTGDVTLSTATTLKFSPNGTVSATTGALTFTLSNGSSSKVITISQVGAVTSVNQ
jgi:type IV fimbrial biogenesis protein FimU